MLAKDGVTSFFQLTVTQNVRKNMRFISNKELQEILSLCSR